MELLGLGLQVRRGKVALKECDGGQEVEAPGGGGNCGPGFTPVCSADQSGQCAEGQEPICPLENMLGELMGSMGGMEGMEGMGGMGGMGEFGDMEDGLRRNKREADAGKPYCQCVPDFLLSFYRVMMMGMGEAEGMMEGMVGGEMMDMVGRGYGGYGRYVSVFVEI